MRLKAFLDLKFFRRDCRGEREFPFSSISRIESLWFPSPNYGSRFFHSLPVPEFLECHFFHFHPVSEFWAWWQTPKHLAIWVILEQACSWPVKRQFFAIILEMFIFLGPRDVSLMLIFFVTDPLIKTHYVQIGHLSLSQSCQSSRNLKPLLADRTARTQASSQFYQLDSFRQQ